MSVGVSGGPGNTNVGIWVSSGKVVLAPLGFSAEAILRRLESHRGIARCEKAELTMLSVARIKESGLTPYHFPYHFPATSLSNRGFPRSGSKLGSIFSQPGERKYGIFKSGSRFSSAFSGSPPRR